MIDTGSLPCLDYFKLLRVFLALCIVTSEVSIGPEIDGPKLVVGNSDVLGMQCCFINWFLTVMLRNHLRNNTASPKHQNYRPLGRVILWLFFGNLNRITNQIFAATLDNFYITSYL